MSSIVELLATRMRGDATLVGTLGANGYSGLLNGGVWTRPLRREPPSATLDAFYDSAHRGKIIRDGVVSIIDRGDSAHPQRPWIPGAYQSIVLIYFYAGATQSGKAAIEAARKRTYNLLDHEATGGWTFATEDGPIAFVNYLDRIGIQNSEEFPEAVFDYCRYGVVSRTANLT